MMWSSWTLLQFFVSFLNLFQLLRVVIQTAFIRTPERTLAVFPYNFDLNSAAFGAVSVMRGSLENRPLPPPPPRPYTSKRIIEPEPVREFVADHLRANLQHQILNRSPHLINNDMFLTLEDEVMINEIVGALNEYLRASHGAHAC